MLYGDNRMVSQAEVEEPTEAPRSEQEEVIPANNIEVEEMAQHPADEELVQAQQSATERQPILLGMSPSMCQQHDSGADTLQEALQSVPEQKHGVRIPSENRGAETTATPARQEEEPANATIEEPAEEVGRRRAGPRPVEEEGEDHHASASTIVSSLHVSSVERRDRRQVGEDISPISDREREADVESHIVSSFAWDREG